MKSRTPGGIRLVRFERKELLFGGGGLHADKAARASAVDELHAAIDLGEEGVVAAAADIEPGLNLCAALADDDGAARDGLTGKEFDAEALRVGVAPVF